MIQVGDYVVDSNWVVHPENYELQDEVDLARAQWSQADGDPIFFVADLIDGKISDECYLPELVEDESLEVVLSRLLEGFDPLKHPRGKDGKFINSGIKTSHWKKNSASEWAKKKIYYMSEMAAQGNWKAVQDAYTPPPAGAKGSAKYVYMAQQNLLKHQQQVQIAEPSGAKPSVEVPGAVTGWKQVGPQLGSNSGGTYQGPDGKYYVKHPPSEDHARSEVLAAKLYEAAGAGVVDAQLVDVGTGKPSVATKWIDASEKVDWSQAKHKNNAAQDYAIHAWLGNWDAIGHPSDPNNVLFVNGKMVSVDVGGSLKYRAQGATKPFTKDCPEWETLRDPSKAEMGSKVFGAMTAKQLYDSAQKLKLVDDKMIDQLCAKYHPGDTELPGILKARRDAILQKADTLASVAGIKQPIVPPVGTVVPTPLQTAAASAAAVKPAISVEAASKQIVDNYYKGLGANTETVMKNWDTLPPESKSLLVKAALNVSPDAKDSDIVRAFASKAASLGITTDGFTIDKLAIQKPSLDHDHGELMKKVYQDKAITAGLTADGLDSIFSTYNEGVKSVKIEKYIGVQGFSQMSKADQSKAMDAFLSKVANKDLAKIVAENDTDAAISVIVKTPATGHFKLYSEFVKAGMDGPSVSDLFEVATHKKENVKVQVGLEKLKASNSPAPNSPYSAEPAKPKEMGGIFADISKSPPSVPPPPMFASKYGASNQSKVNKIHELAGKGDIEGIKAISISTASNDHYTKKAAAYKEQVLNSLAFGGKVSPGHVAPPVKEVPKPEAPKVEKPKGAAIDQSKVIPYELTQMPPDFTTTKVEIKKANEKLASSAYDLAYGGDLEGLKKFKSENAESLSKSSKLSNYVGELETSLQNQLSKQKEIGYKPVIDPSSIVDPPGGWEAHPSIKQMVLDVDLAGLKKASENGPSWVKTVASGVAKQAKDHFNPPPPPPKPAKPFDQKVVDLASAANVNHGSNQKVGYWAIKSKIDLDGPMHVDHAWHQGDHAAWHKENKSQKTSHMKDFTGSWSYYSDPMRAGKEPKHVIEAKQQWKETAKELPEGLTLGRRYDVSNAAEHLASIPIGSIMSDESFLSTSTNPKVWSGNVHVRIKCAKGAKGVVAGSWSNYESESEVIMGAGARFLVVGKHDVPPAQGFKDEKHVIDVILLPPID